MKINRLLFFAFCILDVAGAFAQTIYISPSGNDHNPGTRDKPLATLTAAQDKSRALRKANALTQPVVIMIAPGTYTLSAPLVLTKEDAGTEKAPLVFRGQPDAMPVFSGGQQLPRFEKVSDKLWKVALPEELRKEQPFEQLYVNGKRAVRAQTPNAGSFYKIQRVKGTVTAPGGSYAKAATEKITLRSEDMAWSHAPGWDTADIVMTLFYKWNISRYHLQGIYPSDTSIEIAGEVIPPLGRIDRLSIYTLENAMAFLDAPGEWFLNRAGTLYYIPREGETIEHTTAVAPLIDQFVIIKGTAGEPVKNIRFENLAFRYAAYHMPAGGNGPAQAAADIDAAVTADHAQNISFTNCEIAHTGLYACWFRQACSYSRLVHCYLHDLGAGGVKIGEAKIPADTQLLTRHITLDNNIIRSGGQVFATSVGVLIFNASDNTVTHNEIADFRYSGISAGWIWGYSYSPAKRNNISFNHIHHLGWGVLSDMGGVYTLGASEGTVVSNNVIHDVYTHDYGGWGLYTDEGSAGIVMENNLVYRCKSAGFHQHYGKDNIIRNNIFALQEKAQLQATRVEPHHSFSFTNNIVYFDSGTLAVGQWTKVNMTTDNNCYWDTRTRDILFGGLSFKAWQQSGKDQHSIIADPLFVDPAAGDFHIRNQSMLKSIHFKPFDYSRAGVYGEKKWKNLARFDPQLAQQFDKVVKENSL